MNGQTLWRKIQFAPRWRQRASTKKYRSEGSEKRRRKNECSDRSDRAKKSYGPVEAVRGIDFYVESGTLFAFLGVNGAGKSLSLIHI